MVGLGDEGTEDGGVGFDEAGFAEVGSGGEIGLVVEGSRSRGSGDCGFAVGGMIVGGFGRAGFGGGGTAGSAFVRTTLVAGPSEDEGTLGEGGLAVDGSIVDGFSVDGFNVDGAPVTAIEGCVVGEESDVSGATSIRGTGGAIRPGKTVGGCVSSPASITIGASGRFTDATTAGGSIRRVGC